MENQEFTLSEHLLELRMRLIKMVVVMTLAMGICFYYVEEIVRLLVQPANALDFIYISPPELFLTYIKITVVLGITLSMPFLLLQVWLFVKPGLKKKEKLYVFLSMVMGLVFFLIGVIFAYRCILPLSLKFFVGMSLDKIEPLFSFSNYIAFISSLLASFGIVFELPMVISLLTVLNLINPKQLKAYRKYVVLLIFIVAAFLTPPDIISQILMGLPMLLLFEISLVISEVIYRKKRI